MSGPSKRLKRKPPSLPGNPAPERLARAGDAARVEDFDDDGAVGKRLRIEEGLIARLGARGQLDPGGDLNLVLAFAGEKYCELFYRAGFDPLRARDPTVEVQSAHGSVTLFASEARAQALQLFRAAAGALAEEDRAAFDLLALRNFDLFRVGSALSGYRDRKIASAIALFVLRRGLASLARHFGLASTSAPAMAAGLAGLLKEIGA